MSRRRLVPLVVLLVALLGGGAAWWWSTQRASADPPNRLSGSVEATQYTAASVVAGRVAEVHVAEGAVVKADDPLVTLDAAPLHLAVDQANAGVEAAKALVRQKQDDGTDAEVAEARARQAQAEASVALAQVQLGYATIAAPHDGTVVTVTTNAGQAAAPGRTLVTLLDTGDVWVRAYVPEPQLGAAALDTTVTVSGDGIAPREGHITWVASRPEFTPNTVETRDQRTKLVYELRVALDGTDGVLKPGQPVDVTLP